MARQQVVVRLTMHQALRCEKLAEHLWPSEKLSVEEISRRLLLEHLLWAESERGLVAQGPGTVRGFRQAQG